jgi:putative membrane protein
VHRVLSPVAAGGAARVRNESAFSARPLALEPERASCYFRVMQRTPPRTNAAAATTASREPAVLLALGALALVVSGFAPHERVTWLLEVAPALIAAAALVATRRRFPLTPLAYRLVFAHALILMLGAHYTYARVPLGFWLQDALDLARNHYDRVGHFAQGFVPVIVAREVLARSVPLRRGWLAFLSTCVVLAASAFYEFIEWWAALIGGIAAESFLGTQGDVWDTQWDMFLCLCGAAVSLALCSRRHDRELLQAKRAARA